MLRGVGASILLVNPKYPHNVGAAVRAASCLDASEVSFTGDRVRLENGKRTRLPREERMKAYRDVRLEHVHEEAAFDRLPEGATPVAIELRPSAELLPQFTHPENAVYVFGPEDGGLERTHLLHCHRVVVIPTRHCVNLGAAVYIVLYDRLVKRQANGEAPILSSWEVLDEDRGFIDALGLHSTPS